MEAIGVFALGFVLSLAGGYCLVYSPSLRDRYLVEPAEDRWHKVATPGLGGVPIFIAFVITALVGSLWRDSAALAILAGAVVAFGIGVVDDLRPLTPKVKFGGQLLAALVVVIAGYSSFKLPDIVWYHPVAGVLWTVIVINGINLLDNMDGLASGVTLIASTAIACMSMSAGMNEFGLFYVALAGALAGFLVLKVYPAKLFMGDAGSLWLGLVVGAGSLVSMAVTGVPIERSALVWVVPVLICAAPIMDMTMVIVTRKLRGQPVSQGGRDHLSHRLVSIGLSQKASVRVLWLVGLVSALVALAVINVSAAFWIPLLLCFSAGAIMFVYLIGRTPLDNRR